MSAWRLIPITNGYHILTRVFAGVDPDHLVLVGELTLRRDDYADLAARLGAPQAFDTGSGRPIPVLSLGEPLWVPKVVQSATPVEPDLHDNLHPQPGQPPAAPVPPGVDGWAPGAEIGSPEAGETEGEDLL